jgi:peptide/nickel transport system substrate-binding protein
MLAAMFVSNVARDNTWKPFPQGVEYLPDIKDGTWKLDGERMILSWKLKPRNWHDGTPVACGDYVFALNVARNEQVPNVDRDLANQISNIVCPKGEHGIEVTVTWKERYAYAGLAITGYSALPRHILEPFYRRNPSKLFEIPYGRDPKVTIGDGAYRLVEWRKGESLTVESVGTHPILGTPKIKRITWRFISDPNAFIANMVSGAIDAITTYNIDIVAAQLERQAGGRVKVLFGPGLIWEHIDFNLDNPLLRDGRVRRAIAHGIDRTKISQQVFQGRPSSVSHTYLPLKHPGYTDAVQKYRYDPARARGLLQQAGFTPGPDGIMRNAAGQRLALEINTTTGNPIREQVERIIQEQLREVGIEITILNFPARVLFGPLTQRRQFKALALYAWVFGPTSSCDVLYTSDGIPSEANGWVGQNYPGYRNAEMDKACTGARREVDEVRRNKLLNESAVLFSRDLPALPLFNRVDPVAVKTGLVNFSFGFPCALDCTLSVTWNVHTWFWQ